MAIRMMGSCPRRVDRIEECQSRMQATNVFEISTLSTRVFECPWHIFNGGRSSLLVPTYILQSGSTLHREALCIWTLAWALCFWDRGMARDSHPNSSLVPQF